MKAIDQQMKRGTLEMILMRLLSERPMYGYELVSTLERRGGDVFQLKEGTLYPVLYRLESAGLIEPKWETLERGVPRKYYRLTRAGTVQLKSLVSDWRAFVGAVDRLIEPEGGDR